MPTNFGAFRPPPPRKIRGVTLRGMAQKSKGLTDALVGAARKAPSAPKLPKVKLPKIGK